MKDQRGAPAPYPAPLQVHWPQQPAIRGAENGLSGQCCNLHTSEALILVVHSGYDQAVGRLRCHLPFDLLMKRHSKTPRDTTCLDMDYKAQRFGVFLWDCSKKNKRRFETFICPSASRSNEFTFKTCRMTPMLLKLGKKCFFSFSIRHRHDIRFHVFNSFP